MKQKLIEWYSIIDWVNDKTENRVLLYKVEPSSSHILMSFCILWNYQLSLRYNTCSLSSLSNSPVQLIQNHWHKVFYALKCSEKIKISSSKVYSYEDLFGNHLTSPPPFDLQVSILAQTSYRERMHRLQKYLDTRKNTPV